MRTVLRAFVVCLAAPLSACFGQGTTACYVPPAFQGFINIPRPPGSGVMAFQALGMTYLQIGCTQDARKAFQQEAQEIQSLPVPQQTAVKAVVEILLNYTSGYEAYNKQSYAAALQIFSDVATNSPPAIANAAVITFAELMMQHFDPKFWNDLSTVLHVYEKEGYWRGRYYLTYCGLTPANAAGRVAELQTELMKDLPTEERLSDQIILIDLLGRTDHFLEADLLGRDIEKEVGAKVVAPDLRAFYIQIRLGIASRLAGAGYADAADQVKIFQKALETFNAPN